MIQRRVLVTLLAVTAVTATAAACKKSETGPATTGSGSALAGSGSGSGSALAGSGSAGSGSDLVPAGDGKITRPFFYKVEKDGKTSYLLGTWHMGIDAKKLMPRAVWDAFATSKAFATEIDPTDPAGLSGFMRNDGRTLEQDLGPEYWPKLETLAGPLAEGMKKMKPMGAVLLLQYKDLPQAVPMDLAFLNEAKAEKKALVFLEQVAVQVRLLERWVDLRMLKATIDDLAGTKQKIDEALAAYMVGDDAALVSMVLDREGMKEAGFTDAELDQAMKQMLYDRNAAWIPVLEEMFAKGDAFAAVGAGHLIGGKSVVELLQAKGYTVTRVGST
jgi:uncharacterized protein YbaP (TraB family)